MMFMRGMNEELKSIILGVDLARLQNHGRTVARGWIFIFFDWWSGETTSVTRSDGFTIHS